MRSWKANIAAILAAEILAMIGFGLSMPIIPLFLKEDIGITDPVRLNAWVGIIQSSAAVSLAIFAPIWGHLSDIFSRRTMLLRALFGGALIISLSAFVTTPTQFLILRVIQGCLTGTVAAATVLVAGIAPAAHVAFALGMLTTVIAVGNSLGPVFGGIIADLFGYRIAFFSTGIVLALAGLVVLKWVDKDERPPAEGPPKKLTLIPDFGIIKSSPVLITMMIVTFGIGIGGSISGPTLPLFLRELIINVSEGPVLVGSSVGIVMGVGAAFTALASVLIGKYANQMGYWRTLFLCLGAGALFTLPQTFVSSVAQLTILRAFSSFFTGGTGPVTNAIVAVTADKKNQGTIYGIKASVSSAGNALGPILGAGSAMLSYRLVFLVTAIILGLTALLAKKRTP